MTAIAAPTYSTGRMTRNGGTAVIDSSDGVGTEGHLTMPGGDG